MKVQVHKHVYIVLAYANAQATMNWVESLCNQGPSRLKIICINRVTHWSIQIFVFVLWYLLLACIGYAAYEKWWLVRQNLIEKPKATMFEDIGKKASYSKCNKSKFMSVVSSVLWLGYFKNAHQVRFKRRDLQRYLLNSNVSNQSHTAGKILCVFMQVQWEGKGRGTSITELCKCLLCHAQEFYSLLATKS